MMEPDAAPAGGRRTLLPSTRAAPGLRPAANTSRLPGAGWRWEAFAACRDALTVNGYSQGAGERQGRPPSCSAETKSAARRRTFRLRLWAKRKQTTAN